MSRPTALIWLLLSAVVIVLDQITKVWALARLDYGMPIEVLPVLNWTLVYNTGAAFSFLADHDGWQRWLFSGLAVGISALLTHWLWKLPRGDWREALPLSLIIGGALGNLIDRVRFGYVVDFIDVHWGSEHFPAFNIADSAISIGAVLMVLNLLFPARAAAPR